MMQETMPSIGAIAGDAYVFWQDSVPAHRVRQAIELLQCQTPKFIRRDIWPRNSPYLSLVDY